MMHTRSDFTMLVPDASFLLNATVFHQIIQGVVLKFFHHSLREIFPRGWQFCNDRTNLKELWQRYRERFQLVDHDLEFMHFLQDRFVISHLKLYVLRHKVLFSTFFMCLVLEFESTL